MKRRCTCTRYRLGAKYRNGQPVCLRCNRINDRKAANPGMPTLKPVEAFDRKGRSTRVRNSGTIGSARRVVQDAVDEGCNQNQIERRLRQELCGPGTSKRTFGEAMQAGLMHMESALDARDLPGGSTVTRKQAEHVSHAGEA